MLKTLFLQHPHQVAVQLLLSVYRRNFQIQGKPNIRWLRGQWTCGLLVYIFRGPSRLSKVNQHSLVPGQMSMVRSSSCSWARALGSKHVWARSGTGPYTCWQDLTLAAILSSLALDFTKLALVADSNLFRHEPNFDIQTALRSKPDRCL